jgi:hypothetical protein
MTALASSIPRRGAIRLTLIVTILSCGGSLAAKQSDISPSNPLRAPAVREFAVGDQVAPSVRLDDDGYPDRPYGILIVDGAVVVIIDRVTRRVVQVIR